MKLLKNSTALLGASILLGSFGTANAALIAEENFNYAASIITNDVTNSQLNGANGGTGWTTAWSADNHGNAFTATTQTHPGLVTSGANALSKMALNPGPASWDFGGHRSITPQAGRVWGSATINFALVPQYFEFKLNEASNPNWSARFGFENGNIFSEHSGGNSRVNSAFAPALNTTYFVAFTYNTDGTAPTTFYVNPDNLGDVDGSGEPAGALAFATFSGQNWGMGPMGNVSFYGAWNSLFTIDDIRVGTTWESVSPIPEPSAALLGAIGGLMLLLRRRA